MADELIKISELEPSTDIYDGCCIPIVTNNETKKLTYALLKQKLQNDLDIPEEVVPEFVLDVNGHLLAIFEGEAPIDLGRVKGEAGKLGSVTASVDANTGTPYVVVTYNGENADFAFHNLKGANGVTPDISGKEDKGKLTFSGTQKNIATTNLVITEGGATTTYKVVTVND